MVVGQKTKVIEFPIEDAFVHEYRLRQSGTREMSLEVTIPRDFTRKLFRKSGLPYEDFLERCRVVVFYSGGDDLLLKFEVKPNGASEEPNGSET